MLVQNENLAKELDETIVHEVAHAVDIQRNGYRRDLRGRAIHHDQVFYDIMAELSGKPAESFKRTHDIKELKPTRKYRQFEYQLSNGETDTLTTIRHNKLQKGKVVFYQFRTAEGSWAKAYKHDFIREVV